MTANNGDAGVRLFSIRNLLLAVTILLVLVVVGLNIGQLNRAFNDSDTATRAQVLNGIVDDIVTFKLTLSDERLFLNAAYGATDEVPASVKFQAQANRGIAEEAYGNILISLGELPQFDGEDQDKQRFDQAVSTFNGLRRDLRNAHEVYAGFHDGIDEDLEVVSAGARTQNISDITSAINGLIDISADIRAVLETNYDYGDSRINNVLKLKSQLWLMQEYAGRQAATIARSITSMQPVPASQLSIAQIYDGISKGAWAQAQQIARSTSTTAEIASQMDEIQNVFFDAFEIKRFEIYDLSAEANEEMEDAVDYSDTYLDDDYTVLIDIDGWVDFARTSVQPVIAMSSSAGDLASELNTGAVSSAGTSQSIAWALIVVSLAIGGIAVWIVWMRVVRPVDALSATMMVLADGNLEVEIPNADRNDEMGDMAKSVQIFKDNAVERRRLEAEQREAEERERERREEEERRQREEAEERRVREEEQAEQARTERRQAMLELADQFEASVMALVEGVSTSASGMEQAASSLTDTAADTSQQSEVVANAAQQASSNAQMVASAAEELSASVREITGQTNQSSAAARDAVSRTENAGRDVAELVDAAEKIGEVVKLINEIAEQTNLLALNATIEAARAGDAGKGFAVVASEVKSLANQTAKATQEISEQVTGMQNATGLAVRAMDEIKGIIGDIESTSVSIASAVEEQDASTQEIARNVGEVSTGTEEVTSNIHRVNEGATTTGSAATQVLSAAQLLTQQSGELRGQVEDFLKTIRA